MPPLPQTTASRAWAVLALSPRRHHSEPAFDVARRSDELVLQIQLGLAAIARPAQSVRPKQLALRAFNPVAHLHALAGSRVYMRIYTYAQRQAKSSQKSSSKSRSPQPLRAALPALERAVAWAWRLTRKVKAKTVSIALSEQQLPLYKAAIADHRKLEAILNEMREISDHVLQQSVPGVKKRRREKHPKTPLS